MIEQTADTVAMRISPEEAEAIVIVWRNLGHSEDTIPASDALSILSEVRARRERIEATAQRGLLRAIGENRRSPRRHQVLTLYLIVAIAALVSAGISLVSYFGR